VGREEEDSNLVLFSQEQSEIKFPESGFRLLAPIIHARLDLNGDWKEEAAGGDEASAVCCQGLGPSIYNLSSLNFPKCLSKFQEWKTFPREAGFKMG